MNLNRHHRRALLVLGVLVLLDIFLGVAFGLVMGLGAWHGLYCATATATSLGCDVASHGWLAYTLTAVEMLTILPMFAALASFFTAGLTADHIDKRHDELKQHVTRETSNG